MLLMQNKGIRLQKFLAERGVASRRTCGQYVAAGRVRVNGTIVTQPGIRVDPEKDKVTLDGRVISKRREAHRTILLHKPRGYVCSTFSKQGRTVYALIRDVKERLVPVGRLDKNSEGLLLMSNDGELVNRLTHPRFGQEKTYRVTVSGKVDAVVLKKLRSRLVIDAYRIQPTKVKLLRKVADPDSSGDDVGSADPDSHVHGDVGSADPERFLLEFVLKEGRNRQIRKMCKQAALKVYRLVRVKIGNLALARLKPGQWRDLDNRELEKLSP